MLLFAVKVYAVCKGPKIKGHSVRGMAFGLLDYATFVSFVLSEQAC